MKSYEELLVERDGLSSQLLSLHRILSDARGCVRTCHKQGWVDYKLLQTIDHALQKNSYEQCLAEIKAEAYEAGFSKAKLVYNCELGYCSTDIHEWFDEWESAKVRQGEQSGTWLKDSNVNGGKRQGGE